MSGVDRSRVALHMAGGACFLVLCILGSQNGAKTSFRRSMLAVSPPSSLDLSSMPRLQSLGTNEQQIDYLSFRNMCLEACQQSLPEERPDVDTVHCAGSTITGRWLDYIHGCDSDSKKCNIKMMGCRGNILGFQ